MRQEFDGKKSGVATRLLLARRKPFATHCHVHSLCLAKEALTVVVKI